MNKQHPQEFLDKIKIIETFAEIHGLGISPTCRIKQTEGLIRRLLSPNYNPLNDYDFSWGAYGEGIRDIEEISFICQALSKAHSDDLIKHWHMLMKGAITPDQDSRTHARNIQFQLFLSAYLLKEKGYPIKITEPDILFDRHGKWYGVAAKRLSSADNLDKRVQDGVKQISKSNHPGFVAVSFDRICQTHGWEKVTSESLFSQSPAPILLERTVHENESKITKRLKTPCIGFIGFLKLLYIHESKLGLSINSAAKWFPQPGGPEELNALIKDMSDC